MKNFCESDAFYGELRKLQRRTKCSNKLCEDFAETFARFSKTPLKGSLSRFDTKVKKAAGSRLLALHGCKKCDSHVYKPWDNDEICPGCGHPRFDEDGTPFEVLII